MESDSTRYFWFRFLLLWNLKVATSAIFISLFLSFLLILSLYFYFKMPELSNNNQLIFLDIFVNSLLFTSVFGIVLGFLFSFRATFNQQFFGYKFRFLNSFFGCARSDEKNDISKIDEISLGEIMPIWRKWLWKVVLQTAFLTLIAIIFQKLLNIEVTIFTYYLTLFFLFLIGSFNIYLILKYDNEIRKCNF
jgi:magnesium-transporting ATPase (P-type)